MTQGSSDRPDRRDRRDRCDDGTRLFDAQRGRLLSLAARVLGSRAQAEEVVQDAWLRWREVDAGAVRAPQAWLATVTVRLAIDRLRRQRRESEGERHARLGEPWLADVAPSAEEAGLRAARIAEGLLLLLERLGPVEQVAFVLREAFECDYAEIAALLGCTPAHGRQIVHRAKARLARERAARPAHPADPARHARTAERLRAVLQEQDRAGLMELLGVTMAVLAAADAPLQAEPLAAASGTNAMDATSERDAVVGPTGALRAEALTLDGRPGIALVAQDGEFAAWLHVDVTRAGALAPVVRLDLRAETPALQRANRAFGGRAVRLLLARVVPAPVSAPAGGALVTPAMVDAPAGVTA